MIVQEWLPLAAGIFDLGSKSGWQARAHKYCAVKLGSTKEEMMMLGTWMRFAVQSTLLGLEAQRVMSLRMTAIAQGGSRAHAEMQRMIVEKLVASMRAGAMVTLGKPTTSVIRHYRSRVRANGAAC